jgi:hypothetical protein
MLTRPCVSDNAIPISVCGTSFEDAAMGSNKHAQDRVKTGHTTPPSGHDAITDADHTLRAGARGASQRKRTLEPEAPTRGAGRDDHRSGSDSGKS